MPHLPSNIKLVQANQLQSPPTSCSLKAIMIFWRLQNNLVPEQNILLFFAFLLSAERCPGDEVDYRSQIIHSNVSTCQSALMHRWTITLLFSSKKKNVLEWKHALLPVYLVISIMTTLLTNKLSTRNSLLWQEILMMFLSVHQSLNHGTFHGLKITNWFITWHGNCLLTGSNFSIKIDLSQTKDK